jgi:hypothetical protein
MDADCGSVQSMKRVAQLLNDMLAAGVIQNYALFGAMAQMRYTEAVATLDADVLVAVPSPDKMNVLAGIYAYCREHGFEPEGEAIRVGAWPVQFMPVFSSLTREAMENADIADFEGTPLRVVRADYLAVIALSGRRGKDYARILALLESLSVTREQIAQLASKHDLSQAWQQFEARFSDG